MSKHWCIDSPSQGSRNFANKIFSQRRLYEDEDVFIQFDGIGRGFGDNGFLADAHDEKSRLIAIADQIRTWIYSLGENTHGLRNAIFDSWAEYADNWKRFHLDFEDGNTCFHECKQNCIDALHFYIAASAVEAEIKGDKASMEIYALYRTGMSGWVIDDPSSARLCDLISSNVDLSITDRLLSSSIRNIDLYEKGLSTECRNVDTTIVFAYSQSQHEVIRPFAMQWRKAAKDVSLASTHFVVPWFKLYGTAENVLEDTDELVMGEWKHGDWTEPVQIVLPCSHIYLLLKDCKVSFETLVPYFNKWFISGGKMSRENIAVDLYRLLDEGILTSEQYDSLGEVAELALCNQGTTVGYCYALKLVAELLARGVTAISEQDIHDWLCYRSLQPDFGSFIQTHKNACSWENGITPYKKVMNEFFEWCNTYDDKSTLRNAWEEDAVRAMQRFPRLALLDNEGSESKESN